MTLLEMLAVLEAEVLALRAKTETLGAALNEARGQANERQAALDFGPSTNAGTARRHRRLRSAARTKRAKAKAKKRSRVKGGARKQAAANEVRNKEENKISEPPLTGKRQALGTSLTKLRAAAAAARLTRAATAKPGNQ